jgi:flavin-dependent dehydrogenase
MHDLIVSGAGPAGSYTAYLCARKGLDVLLLEKGQLGKKKCCAGGLLERSLRAMDGISIPESLVERELTGFSFVVQGERFPFRLQRPLGIMVRREAFDLHLARSAEKAGAQLSDGVKVLSAREEADRILVRTSNGEMEAKYLAIAEGASSPLTDSLMGMHPAHWSAMGSALEVRTNAQPSPSMEIHLLSLDGRVLRTGPSFPLTGAVFPLRGSVIVSAVGKSCSAADMRAGLENMKDRVVDRAEGETINKACFHPLPIVPRKRMSSARAIVVGDAAGLVSPFSGEGLSSAIMSATLGSQALVQTCQSGKAAELKRYEDEVRRKIVPRLTAASLVGPWLHWSVHRFGHERLMRNFGRQEALVDACAGFSSGELSLGDFTWRTIPFLPFMFRSVKD